MHGHIHIHAHTHEHVHARTLQPRAVHTYTHAQVHTACTLAIRSWSATFGSLVHARTHIPAVWSSAAHHMFKSRAGPSPCVLCTVMIGFWVRLHPSAYHVHEVDAALKVVIVLSGLASHGKRCRLGCSSSSCWTLLNGGDGAACRGLALSPFSCTFVNCTAALPCGL
jgi:hypothetical protein